MHMFFCDLSLAHFHLPEVFLEAVSLPSSLPKTRARICLHFTSPYPVSAGLAEFHFDVNIFVLRLLQREQNRIPVLSYMPPLGEERGFQGKFLEVVEPKIIKPQFPGKGIYQINDIDIPPSTKLVPLCFMIFDLEPLSSSFDFVFDSEIFKSFSCLTPSSLPSSDLVS
nr:hypothetical protein [Tanacetum cinerariifolium]